MSNEQQTHDLQFYLDNPDQIPDDPAILSQLAEQINTPVVVENDPKETEKDVKKEEPATSSEDPKKAEPEKVETKDDEQKPIATRDGKGTIPYEVLKTEREKRQAAEAAVAELNQKVTEIQEQLAKGTGKGDAKAEELGKEALANLSPEELDALRTDFPVFGTVIDKLMGTISSLTNQVSELKQSEQNREADTRRSTAKTVQELIDDEPVLLYLQTKDTALFDKAIEIDNTLKGDPRYPDMATRFKKVAEIMETTFGPFDGVTSKKVSGADKEPSVSKEDAREAVIKKVSETKAAPKSMSDIPAGDLPESDEITQMENLSAAEITDRLMKMPADQRTAFLNRF